MPDSDAPAPTATPASGFDHLTVKLKQVRPNGDQVDIVRLTSPRDAVVHDLWRLCTSQDLGTRIPHGTSLEAHDTVLLLTVRNAIVDTPLKLPARDASALLKEVLKLTSRDHANPLILPARRKKRTASRHP